MYLSKHDADDERAAAEAGYADRLAEAQEELCVSRGPEYRTTIADLRGKIKALLVAMHAMEWVYDEQECSFACPSCGYGREYGHAKADSPWGACQLAAAIALATEAIDEAR